MTREEVNNYIELHQILPELKFGQNFLCDNEIIDSIIEVSNIRNGDCVLEIGPGIGALTRPLIESGVNISCVEIDKRLSQYLKEDFPQLNLYVNDYLKLDNYNKSSYKYAISNIPYYVMTPIMMKLFNDLSNCQKMTFMIEDEAFRRIEASVGSKQYGPLSVMCHIFGDIKKEFVVPRNCFVPMPHTTSCVITITRGDLEIKNGLVDFVTKCFSNRRKKLTNTIPELKPILNNLGIPDDIRAEKLTPSDFVRLFSEFCKDDII